MQIDPQGVAGKLAVVGEPGQGLEYVEASERRLQLKTATLRQHGRIGGRAVEQVGIDAERSGLDLLQEGGESRQILLLRARTMSRSSVARTTPWAITANPPITTYSTADAPSRRSSASGSKLNARFDWPRPAARPRSG